MNAASRYSPGNRRADRINPSDELGLGYLICKVGAVDQPISVPPGKH